MIPHGRLFWRVYLHGFGMLLLVTLAMALVGVVLGRAPNYRAYPERLAAYLSERVADLNDRPEVIERDLMREQELIDGECAYHGDRRVEK